MSGIVVTIALAAHRDFETMVGQTSLLLVRAILRLAIRMVNTAFRRLATGTDRRSPAA